jgi:hypothetical protein
MKKKVVSPPTLYFSIIMFLSGLVLVLLVQLMTGQTDTIFQKIGFAFIVSSVVALFQETVIARSKKDETDERFSHLHETMDKVDTKIDTRFREFEESYGSKALAIRLIAPKRAGYDAYHHWLVHTTPEDMFFAGHSVLHRVQIDLTKRNLGKVEDRIVTRLAAGCSIRMVFLNPTWDFIENIAKSENQPYEKMMTDLAITLGICRRLWSQLEEEHPISGSFHIWLCNEIQQYAFHSITNRETGARQLLVGLYFANILGMNSPLFSVDHKDIQDTFTAHFTTIANRAVSLMEYSPPIKHFNHDLYHHCRDALCTVIGQSLVDQYCPT